MIQLIVFLGNPGAQYAQTRHNIAWMLADELQVSDWQSRFKGSCAKLFLSGESRHILKPETFMNRSGESVQALMHFFKIEPESMLVVHDDIELAFGVAGYRKGGGLGGHNGLRSIKTAIGTPDFFRFRIGVGRPEHGSVSSYVLGKFKEEESAVLPLYLEKAGILLGDALLNQTKPEPGGKKVKLI